MQAEPLRTPAYMSGLIFSGLSTGVRVALFTVLHFVTFGIIGIIAKTPVAAELIEGLRRLEYRGYDSAGVATLINGRIVRVTATTLLRTRSREPTPPASTKT